MRVYVVRYSARLEWWMKAAPLALRIRGNCEMYAPSVESSAWTSESKLNAKSTEPSGTVLNDCPSFR